MILEKISEGRLTIGHHIPQWMLTVIVRIIKVNLGNKSNLIISLIPP